MRGLESYLSCHYYVFSLQFICLIQRGLYDKPELLEAFITPAFEIKGHLRHPEDKREMLDLLERNDARQFHEKTCEHCHAPTQYDEWKQIQIRNVANTFLIAWLLKHFISLKVILFLEFSMYFFQIKE